MMYFRLLIAAARVVAVVVAVGLFIMKRLATFDI